MTTQNRIRLLLIGATLIVIATLIVGLIAIGPPELQRKHKFDEQRVADLKNISLHLKYYAGQHQQLPADLATLAKQPGLHIPSDPESGLAYEYKTTAGGYQLCAIFALESEHGQNTRAYSDSSEWPHGSGRNCFDRQPGKQPASD
jgi:hypothetical protein